MLQNHWQNQFIKKIHSQQKDFALDKTNYDYIRYSSVFFVILRWRISAETVTLELIIQLESCCYYLQQISKFSLIRNRKKFARFFFPTVARLNAQRNANRTSYFRKAQRMHMIILKYSTRGYLYRELIGGGVNTIFYIYIFFNPAAFWRQTQTQSRFVYQTFGFYVKNGWITLGTAILRRVRGTDDTTTEPAAKLEPLGSLQKKSRTSNSTKWKF